MANLSQELPLKQQTISVLHLCTVHWLYGLAVDPFRGVKLYASKIDHPFVNNTPRRDPGNWAMYLDTAVWWSRQLKQIVYHQEAEAAFSHTFTSKSTTCGKVCLLNSQKKVCQLLPLNKERQNLSPKQHPTCVYTWWKKVKTVLSRSKKIHSFFRVEENDTGRSLPETR